jgi:hypothetical protein
MKRSQIFCGLIAICIFIRKAQAEPTEFPIRRTDL